MALASTVCSLCSLPDVRDNFKSYHNGTLRATGPGASETVAVGDPPYELQIPFATRIPATQRRIILERRTVIVGP
jgi:hypothetical protein